MLFVSDLDGTVVYSRRTAHRALTGLVGVEEYDGTMISWVTPDSWRLLARLSADGRFVPCTTRTWEQYRRIDLNGRPEWVICCNGGAVYRSGRLDRDWDETIRASEPPELAAAAAETAGRAAAAGWTCRYVPPYFFYLVVPPGTPTTTLDQIESRLPGGEGWHVHRHRDRKIYWISDAVSKGAAARYVAERTGSSVTLAAGDEELDLPLLSAARRALLPRHSSLVGTAAAAQAEVTAAEGVAAGEEILTRAVAELSG
ncbi:MAG: hypothetical protein FWH11_06140 [Micrococcales bacterium]|nr:hypothetical protein [Micrococcales bacterium]